MLKKKREENNFIFGELTYWPFNSCWKSVTKYMMISWIQYLIHRLGQYWSKNTTCPSASPKNKMVAEESNLWNAFVFFLFFLERSWNALKWHIKISLKKLFKKILLKNKISNCGTRNKQQCMMNLPTTSESA